VDEEAVGIFWLQKQADIISIAPATEFSPKDSWSAIQPTAVAHIGSEENIIDD